ncbi:SRSO17 transposase, partial [Streptomyces spectabilis]
MAGAQYRAVQRLQFFLSEAPWEHEEVNARRLERLLDDPRTAPHPDGVLVVDDSGDPKDATTTAHVGRQRLGRYGKTDNAAVTVTTLWADENLYYPLHAVPYTPAHHFDQGRSDPGFRTKWPIAAHLARQARSAGVPFRSAVADGAYGDVDDFRCARHAADVPFVMAVRRRRGTWARTHEAHTPIDAALELAWHGPERAGDWTPVTRTFRDGHTAIWWAADATLGFWG